MVVCIEPVLGMFFRINSQPNWQTPVRLELSDHPFLDRDSYLECGDPFELDDYVIEESIRRHGIIGKVIPTLAPSIFAAAQRARTVSDKDKDAIRKSLGC